MHQQIMVWLEMAGAALRRSLDSDLLIEEKKSPRDLVTHMDKQIERLLSANIKEYYPDHRILGEEGIESKPQDTNGIIWVIDPIDGTMNFIKQKRHFGIMIGIFEDGIPIAGYIYDVVANELYYGIVGDGAYCNNLPMDPLEIKNLHDGLLCVNLVTSNPQQPGIKKLIDTSLGVRSYGAAALEIIAVLRGEVAAYLSNGLHPWDFAAGYALCSSMGMKVTTLDGKKPNILERSSIVFAPEHIHQEIITTLNNLEK